jgi:hypothetical protein
MSLADEIKKLEDLRWNGTLTDAEFARAKAALIAKLEEDSPEPAKDGAAGEALTAQVADLRYQNELARIDREWQLEREQYTVRGKHGVRHIPTTAMGYGTAAVGGVFGLIWTVMAISITSSGPDFGPFSVAKVVFPIVGVALTIGAVVYGVYCVNKAEGYNKALAAYQARRAAVKPEDFR